MFLRKKTPAIVKCNSHYWTCLGPLWQCYTNRNDPIHIAPPKVAKVTTVLLSHAAVTAIFTYKLCQCTHEPLCTRVTIDEKL